MRPEDGKEVKYPAAGSIREAAPFVALAGEAKKGDEFMEFYADEVALAQTVQDIFYR